MKTNILLDQIELELVDRLTRRSAVDRLEILEVLSQELNALTGMGEWEWAQVHVKPIVTTIASKREYRLPENFPQNFVRGGDTDGEKYLCKIDDGSSESLLKYQSLGQFYSEDTSQATTSVPSTYTISTKPSGVRELLVKPLPDDAYEISGVYVPTDWELREDSELPPIPGNMDYLKWATIFRLATTNDKVNRAQMYMQQALVKLQLQHAKSRRSQLTPRLRSTGMRNEYELMR